MIITVYKCLDVQQFDAILSCFQAEVNIFHTPAYFVLFEVYHFTSSFMFIETSFVVPYDNGAIHSS